MSKLVVFVPVGRRSAGRGVLLGRDGTIRLRPFRVVATASASTATASGNPDRDWRKPYGDTPTGSYLVAGAIPPGAETFGDESGGPRLGALVLLPNGGNALEALRAGRTRFLLHAGRPDADGRLEATFGGLRVAEEDLAALLHAVNQANADGDPLSSVEVEETTAAPWLEVEDEEVPSSHGRAAKSRARVPASGRPPVSRSVLAALGFGAADRRASKGSGAAAVPTRRAFVGLATVTFGLMAFACTGSDSVPGGGGGGGSDGSSGSGHSANHDGGGTTTSGTTTTGLTTTGGATTGDTTTGDTTTGDTTTTTTGDTTTTTTTTGDTTTTTTTTTSDTTTTTTGDTTTTTTSDTTTTTTGDTTTTTGDTTTGDTTTTTGDTTTTTGDTTTTTGDTTTTTGDTTTFFIKTPTPPQKRRGGPPPGGGTGT